MVRLLLLCVLSIHVRVLFLSGGLKPNFYLWFFVGCLCFWIMSGFHRRRQFCALAAVAGVFLVFLPAYSPDFNRIENRWVNMKRALPDLMPGCGSVQEAVYTCFENHNS